MALPYAESLGGRISAEWVAANCRAEHLLESLLTREQRSQWRRWSAFWVETTRGRFRIGQFGDTRYRPVSKPDREFRYCIGLDGVYADWQPLADHWVTLLLHASHNPGELLRRGILRGVRATNEPLLARIRRLLAETGGERQGELLVDFGTVLLVQGRWDAAEAAFWSALGAERLTEGRREEQGQFPIINLIQPDDVDPNGRDTARPMEPLDVLPTKAWEWLLSGIGSALGAEGLASASGIPLAIDLVGRRAWKPPVEQTSEVVLG